MARQQGRGNLWEKISSSGSALVAHARIEAEGEEIVGRARPAIRGWPRCSGPGAWCVRRWTKSSGGGPATAVSRGRMLVGLLDFHGGKSF